MVNYLNSYYIEIRLLDNISVIKYVYLFLTEYSGLPIFTLGYQILYTGKPVGYY